MKWRIYEDRLQHMSLFVCLFLCVGRSIAALDPDSPIHHHEVSQPTQCHAEPLDQRHHGRTTCSRVSHNVHTSAGLRVFWRGRAIMPAVQSLFWFSLIRPLCIKIHNQSISQSINQLIKSINQISSSKYLWTSLKLWFQNFSFYLFIG